MDYYDSVVRERERRRGWEMLAVARRRMARRGPFAALATGTLVTIAARHLEAGGVDLTDDGSEPKNTEWVNDR